MIAVMDKIMSLSEGGDGPGELQQYLSSLSNDQVTFKVVTIHDACVLR